MRILTSKTQMRLEGYRGATEWGGVEVEANQDVDNQCSYRHILSIAPEQNA